MKRKQIKYFAIALMLFFVYSGKSASAASSADCYSYVQTDTQLADPDNPDSDFVETVVDPTPIPDTIAPNTPDQFYTYISNDFYKGDTYSYIFNTATNEEEAMLGTNLEEQKTFQQKSGKPVIAWGAVNDSSMETEDGNTYQIQLPDGTLTYGNEIKGYRVVWSSSSSVDMSKVGIFQKDDVYRVPLLNQSGTYYLHVQSVDTCGNYSNTSTFAYAAKPNIPKFSPSYIANIVPKAGVFRVKNILNINLTSILVYPDDLKTKIRSKELYYRLSNTGKFKKVSGWNSKKDPGTTIKLKPGKHKLQYYAMDNWGFYKSATKKVKFNVVKK